MTRDDYEMDRPREVGAVLSVGRIARVAVGLVVIVVLIAIDRWWLRSAPGVDLADFLTADVRRGELLVEVQGAGALEPVSERWITAAVQGTVEEVMARPGRKLARGDKVVRLANPQVRRRLAQARLALAEAEADHRSHGANVTDRILAAEARLLDAQSDFDEQELRLQAQMELRKQNAISAIDFETQRIRTDRAKAKLESERRRLQEQQAALGAERDASEARVAVRRAALLDAEAEMVSLDVAADRPGTLRELLVDPGVHVAAGARIARVADTSSLVAVVRVPEFYASRLTSGQPALVAVLNSTVAGVVTRVDPAVTQGTVVIGIELAGALPTGARPDLSVRASITVSELRDALVVRRPLYVRDNATADVFVLARDGRLATRTTVRFGMGTLKDVEVVEGLREGDTLLLGNATRLEGLDVVQVR